MKKTTLGEFGRNLPTGKIAGKEFLRDFSLKEFNFGMDRKIAKAREKTPNLTAPHLITLILSNLLQSITGTACDPSKPEENKVELYKCYMADVFYMWLWARYESMGEALELPFQCVNLQCMHKEDIIEYNLKGIDVFVSENTEELQGEIKLSQKYNIRGEQVKVFKVKPPMWALITQISDDDFNHQAAVFKSSIYATDKHDQIILLDQELDQLKRKDYKAVIKKIDDISPGPRLIIENECPKCGNKTMQQLDWEYDNFFE